MTKDQVQPIFILSEDTKRTAGKDAQRMNIQAAKLVGETVRTTLGPKGMDKMIVNSMNEVIITNDGVTILDEMNIEHPSAKMVVEVAKTQENEVGDGTTTAVVLAGELLKRAEELLDQEVHPTVIAKGYRMAAEKANTILHAISRPVTQKDSDILKSIAITAMTGKGAESAKEYLAKLVISAILKVGTLQNNKFIIDRNNIRIETKTGQSIEDSELIEGLVLDKEKVHSAMPAQVKNAKIALLDAAVEIKGTETEAKIQINDPEKLQAFLDYEEQMLKKMVEKITASGANVLFCQKGIDDVAQHYFAKKGIYAARRIKKSDMEALAKATGASIVSSIDDLSANDLGRAGLVEEVRFKEDEYMTYVRDAKQAKAVTILIRGSTEHVIDEIKRALVDAIGDIVATMSNNKAVAGAGATEIELSKQLNKYSESLSGREQLAVRAFAHAMEVIPRTLAENAGLDPIDVLTELKAAHDKKLVSAGINVFTGKLMDSWKEGVIEPLKIKTQAVSSAAEVATMILRIDDVILGGSGSPGAIPPPRGGMGGMPPGMGM